MGVAVIGGASWVVVATLLGAPGLVPESAPDPVPTLGLLMEFPPGDLEAEVPADAVVVSLVFRGSPAFRAGLRPGDILLRIDGRPFSTTVGSDPLLGRRVGEEVELERWREGRGETLVVELGDSFLVFSQACDEGEPVGCLLLGSLFEDGVGVARDEARAASLYHRVCSEGIEPGCTALAAIHLYSEASAFHDPAHALRILEEACDSGEPVACAHLGFLLFSEEGVAPDISRARNLLDRSCEAGFPPACLGLAMAHIAEGRDLAAALGSLDRACREGVAEGCALRVLLGPPGASYPVAEGLPLFEEGCSAGDPRMCTLLGLLEIRGAGTPKDVEGGLGRLRATCAAGAQEVCVLLGMIHLVGVEALEDPSRLAPLTGQSCPPSGCSLMGILFSSRPPDTAESSLLLEQACEGDVAPACGDLGWARQALDPVSAAAAFERGCRGEDPNACHGLGWLKESGRGVESDPAGALDLYERACDGGIALACVRLARALQLGYIRPRDDGRARELLARACDDGVPQGCTFLGMVLVFETDAAARDRGTELLRRGCNGGDPQGCAHLAYLYQHGIGVEQDETTARGLRDYACRGGYAPACESSP